MIDSANERNSETVSDKSKGPDRVNLNEINEIKVGPTLKDGVSKTSVRTYAAKEAVRLARERVKRNDMIVSQLMERNKVKHVSKSTNNIEFSGPGELRRPKSAKDFLDQQIDRNEKVDPKIESEESSYRIKTGPKIFRLIRDLFD